METELVAFLCPDTVIFVVLEISLVVVVSRKEVALTFSPVLVEVALVKGAVFDDVHPMTFCLSLMPLTQIDRTVRFVYLAVS